MYGNVVDVGDGTGVLDLRDWMACPECAEPVPHLSVYRHTYRHAYMYIHIHPECAEPARPVEAPTQKHTNAHTLTIYTRSCALPAYTTTLGAHNIQCFLREVLHCECGVHARRAHLMYACMYVCMYVCVCVCVKVCFLCL